MKGCNNSGSRIHITVGGQKYSARGFVTVKPGNVETEAGANQDGSMHLSHKPVLPEMEIKFSDKPGLVPEDLHQGCIDVTAVMPDLDRTYLFTQAALVGRPEINMENGELTGLKVCSSQAQTLHK